MMYDKDHNDADLERLGVLHEQRRLGRLDEPGQRELDALLAQRPDLRDLVETLVREDDVMQATIDAALDHFDFDKAKTAVQEKLKHDRLYLRMLGVICGSGLLMATLCAWAGFMRWSLVPFIAAAWSLPIAIHWCVMLRRRTIAARIADGSVVLASKAFESHRSIARNERVVMQAVGIICTIGLTIGIVDSILDEQYWRAAIFVFALGFLVPAIWRLYGSSRARQRHEKMISGELNASAWLSGKDTND